MLIWFDCELLDKNLIHNFLSFNPYRYKKLDIVEITGYLKYISIKKKMISK